MCNGEPLKSKVVDFIRSIGIEAIETPGVSGFLPGIVIDAGRLRYDIQLASAADLLHEAGHLAITPPEYRPYMSGGLKNGFKHMMKALESGDVGLDSPLFKAIMQCSDTEVTAWAYAAGVHLELPANMIIDKDSYDGTGADILLSLQLNAYAGISGLHHSGMSVRGKEYAAMLGTHPYPHMQRWTQPAGLSKKSAY